MKGCSGIFWKGQRLLSVSILLLFLDVAWTMEEHHWCRHSLTEFDGWSELKRGSEGKVREERKREREGERERERHFLSLSNINLQELLLSNLPNLSLLHHPTKTFAVHHQPTCP